MSKRPENRISTRRERTAWYMYDFGNSAYAAVVLLAVYAAYFKGQVVGGAQGSWLWGLSVGIAMLAVALTAPILGTIADYSGGKKRFLLFFTALSCVFTALLAFVGKGDIFMGMIFFILAEIGYRSAQVFYNALLPEIASVDEIGRISGRGWAIGSAGGIVCLIIVLALIQIFPGTLSVRFSFVLTALFYAGFALPIFRSLPERAEKKALPSGSSLITLAFTRLGATLKNVRHFKEFGRFILAFLVYNDGILMMLNFAAILGAVLFGLTQTQLILFMIMVQVTSIAGAYVFGHVTDRFSAKRSILIALGLMLVAVVWLYFDYSRTLFFVIGGIAGFALTAAQSVSRTLVGKLAPAKKSAEFYGFFAMTGRTSSFIGPTVYGFIAAHAALWYQRGGQEAALAEQSGQRMAILSIAVFLFVGFVALLFVNEKRGVAAAQKASEPE
ncbi:MAG TPA: MFS transporter [Candidatus Acetothermia bacterium]|nr:MFS transporter [Candidatus Acetothermia bacterium]